MQTMTDKKIYEEDGYCIATSNAIDWKQLNNSHVLITGATGLIGTTLIRGIMAYNALGKGTVHVLAYVRNMEKANALFEEYIAKGWLNLVVGDILQDIVIDEQVDYILHGASETASKAFVEKPVETILTAIEGTKNLLEFAHKRQVKSMVYMSSMEVYGTPKDSEPLTEDKMGYLNPLAVRSSYSESKRMVENLCVAYASEYNVPVKIVRLTQTFGPGVLSDDGRVFAEFARCATQGRDICLQTKGETKRMYLYTADAATALLTVLTKGQNAEAYNAANPITYCSIREMADMVASEFGKGNCQVKLTIPDNPNTSYNPTHKIYMDISKLESLGWKSEKGLREMYERMILCMV